MTSTELPPLCLQFKLPDAFQRIEQIEARSVLDRATASFRRAKTNYLRAHEDIHGSHRDYACTYTQKVHDQVQGQLSGIYTDMLTIQAVLYSFLELAFERIEQIENDRLHYRGVWKDGEFSKGSVVTHGGCCWHANTMTNARPVTDPNWTLMVKRGRDEKDAR